MRRLLLAVFLASLAMLQSAAPAAPFTDAFAELQPVLEAQRDTLFPPLDKTGKRQKAAVLRALKLLAKTSKNLTGDVRLAAQIVPSLEKAYPVDLGPTPVTSDLRAAVGATLTRLRTLVGERRNSLGGSVTVLPPSAARDKLQVLLGNAGQALTDSAAELSPGRSAKLIQSADRLITKGFRLFGRSRDSLSGSVSGEPFAATKVTGVYVTATQILTITGTLSRTGVFREVVLTGTADGQGPAQMTATWRQGTSASTATTFTTNEPALVNVLTLDLVGRRAAGTFDFVAFDSEQNPIDVGLGTFLTKIVVE